MSGGADSTALLLLAAAAYPDAVAAATVDHRMRPEAAEEARGVAALCARLGVPHATLRDPPYDVSGLRNRQERARAIRYGCLLAWAGDAEGDGKRRIDWVAVAHQRDDVAETFLMRAARSAGLGGLAAMRRRRPLDPLQEHPVLLRPLLGWSRVDLARIVAGAGVETVDDPGNVDPSYTRARTRALLAREPELRAARLAKAAGNLRDAEDAIEWFVLRELGRRVAEDADGSLWLDPHDLPFEFQRRFVIRAVEGVRQAGGMCVGWRTGGVERLVGLLRSGKGGTIAGIQARALDGRWHFRPAPPRRGE